MNDTLDSRGVSADSVITSELAEQILQDLSISSVSLDKQDAKRLLDALLKRMGVDIPKSQKEQTLVLCFGQSNDFSLIDFRSLLSRMIPEGELVHI